MERERVLSIRDLEISFDTVHGKATAIRGMRFDLYRGETVAIVGGKRQWEVCYHESRYGYYQ